jgi:hypothetical protein
MSWLLTLKKADGGSLSYSSYNTHRAGLFNLFRLYNVAMPNTLERELTTLFKGLKRKIARDTTAGTEKIKVGKDPLSFSLYQFLCTSLLKEKCKDAIFTRTFLIISWNLMCRASNGFQIQFAHMEWKEDALRIYFAHMKNDQCGERPRDPRHIYANPVLPEVCPILALGIYWSCFSFDTDSLFPGNNQYERFRKQLQVLFSKENVKDELNRRGIDSDDIGTHSIRKGSSTFCASGSTACPSSTAIHLRAGWSFGGVQNTYLRYESAGDMYVGRTVSGLPLDSYKFAILPPHFPGATNDVKTALSVIFPGLPRNLRYIAEFALASLVYHVPFLRTNIPPEHRIFNTPLFQDKDLLVSLSKQVRCCYESTKLKASGVPPHISLLSQMKGLQQDAVRTLEAIEKNRLDVVQDIVRELEERAIGARAVTYDGLDMMIESCLERAGIPSLVERLSTIASGTTASNSSSDPPSSESEESRCFYYWDNRYRRVPKDFVFPECGVRQMWQLWMCGHTAHGYMPLRHLESIDLNIKDSKKRLSDLRFIMHMLEEKAQEEGVWSGQRPSLLQANEMYDACKIVVEVPIETENKKRKRRREQLTWRTVVNLLRRKQLRVHS